GGLRVAGAVRPGDPAAAILHRRGGPAVGLPAGRTGAVAKGRGLRRGGRERAEGSLLKDALHLGISTGLQPRRSCFTLPKIPAGSVSSTSLPTASPGWSWSCSCLTLPDPWPRSSSCSPSPSCPGPCDDNRGARKGPGRLGLTQSRRAALTPAWI